MIAIPSGSRETSVKKTQSTTYWVALGFSCEIAFRASGMKPPGFASTAPAPTIAITGDEATLLMRSTMLSIFAGSGGRRSSRQPKPATSTAATMSNTLTHVFWPEVEDGAAALPSTKAARTPIASVAVNAPR